MMTLGVGTRNADRESEFGRTRARLMAVSHTNNVPAPLRLDSLQGIRAGLLGLASPPRRLCAILIRGYASPLTEILAARRSTRNFASIPFRGLEARFYLLSEKAVSTVSARTRSSSEVSPGLARITPARPVAVQIAPEGRAKLRTKRDPSHKPKRDPSRELERDPSREPKRDPSSGPKRAQLKQPNCCSALRGPSATSRAPLNRPTFFRASQRVRAPCARELRYTTNCVAGPAGDEAPERLVLKHALLLSSTAH
ncbi:hypothetical protein BDY21DRAFT_146370 [Lineolata rhizophorae]|uniref:Uncharacterized protein n=1 Tax=Lineolata rhizophorae TaxID=578093 RepID=A0A6A6NMV3_9PEZI|nr:hypothetical protein BDY21DRAFT_146370 [Lineolata rhizophorae]